jgi:hypothetical protein
MSQLTLIIDIVEILGEKIMPIIKIPRHYLISQDEDLITLDLPESILSPGKKDYGKITQAKGILKDKKAAILIHLDNLRQEWGE